MEAKLTKQPITSEEIGKALKALDALLDQVPYNGPDFKRIQKTIVLIHKYSENLKTN